MDRPQRVAGAVAAQIIVLPRTSAGPRTQTRTVMFSTQGLWRDLSISWEGQNQKGGFIRGAERKAEEAGEITDAYAADRTDYLAAVRCGISLPQPAGPQSPFGRRTLAGKLILQSKAQGYPPGRQTGGRMERQNKDRGLSPGDGGRLRREGKGGAQQPRQADSQRKKGQSDYYGQSKGT